jgi:hypothetical protein
VPSIHRDGRHIDLVTGKGRLLITRAGTKVCDEPGALWDYLAERLTPTGKGDFAEHYALLVVAYTALSPNEAVPFETIAGLLGELGWRREGQSRVRGHDLYGVAGSPLPVLNNIGEGPKRVTFNEPAHPTAAALAHYALLRG